MASTSINKERPTAKQGGRDLYITRLFDAPREVVWKAWTDPEHFKRWWGPKGFTVPSVSIDLRPGGKYLYCMRGAGADGVVSDIWGTGTYKEIVPQERLVYTDSFADEKGNIVPASHYGMEGEFSLEMLVTLTFEDLGRRTGFTLRHAGIPEGEMIELTRGGWNESFDKLAELLEEDRVRRAA